MGTSNRIHALDSIRGLAALVVVFSHCLSPLPVMSLWGYPYKLVLHGEGEPAVARAAKWALTYTPLRALWSGHEAVMLFFVLSGFVLALPFLKGAAPRYGQYAVKRWCRIYIPYIISVGAAGVAMTLLSARGIPELSSWFNLHWRHPVTAWNVVDHIFVLGYTTDDLNGPVWSLVHEIRISLIFPLLIYAVKRAGVLWSLALAAGLYWVGLTQSHNPNLAQVASLLQSVMYSSFFVVGGVLASKRQSVAALLKGFGPFPRFLFLLSATALYANLADSTYKSFVSDWSPAVGAAMIIASAMAFRPLRTFLERPALLWLGKVSYSLYLTHYIVIQALMYSLQGRVPFYGISLMAPPIALLIGWLFYEAFEAPAIELGQMLGPPRTPRRPSSPPGVAR